MTVASSSVGSPTVVAPPGVAPPAVDEVFAQPLDRADDFTFNEEVAGVFDDMVSRSVPQYAEIQRMLAELPARVPRWWLRLAGLRETFATTLFNWRRVLIKEYSAPLGWTLPIVLIGLWNIHQTTGLAQRPVAVVVLWTLLGTAALLWLTLGALKKTRVLALAEG